MDKTGIIYEGGWVIRNLAGTGEGGCRDGSKVQAQFDFPISVVVDERGDVYVADLQNHRLRKIQAIDGSVVTVAGTGERGSKDGAAREAQFENPIDVAFGADGDIIVSELSDRIRVFSPNTNTVRTLADTEVGFSYPSGVGLAADGNVLVSDANNHRIIKLGAGGGDVETVAGGEQPGFANGPGHAANFRCPWGITVNPVGDIFVADRDNHCIRKIDARSGEVTTVAGTGSQGWRDGEACDAQFNRPSGVAIGIDGCVYISEVGNHCVRKLDLVNGSVVTLVGVGEEGSCDAEDGKVQQFRPDGLAVGHDGVVYVADGENHCIRVIIKKTESELEDIEKELIQKVQRQEELAKDLEKATALTLAAKQDLDKTRSAMTRANEQLTEVQNKLKEKRLILHSIVVRRKAKLLAMRDEVSKMENAKQKQISEFSSVKAELMKARTARYKVAMEIASSAQELKRVDQQLKRAMEETDMVEPLVSDEFQPNQMEYDSGMIGRGNSNEYTVLNDEKGPREVIKTVKKGNDLREMVASPTDVATAPRDVAREPREVSCETRKDDSICQVGGEACAGAAQGAYSVCGVGEVVGNSREVALEPREMSGGHRELVSGETCGVADWAAPMKRSRTPERDVENDMTMRKQRKTPCEEEKNDATCQLPQVTENGEASVGMNNGALELDLDLDAVNVAMQETQRVLDRAIEENQRLKNVIPSECEHVDYLDKKDAVCIDE